MIITEDIKYFENCLLLFISGSFNSGAYWKIFENLVK